MNTQQTISFLESQIAALRKMEEKNSSKTATICQFTHNNKICGSETLDGLNFCNLHLCGVDNCINHNNNIYGSLNGGLCLKHDPSQQIIASSQQRILCDVPKTITKKQQRQQQNVWQQQVSNIQPNWKSNDFEQICKGFTGEGNACGFKATIGDYCGRHYNQITKLSQLAGICQGTTANGNPCDNKAKYGKYCGIHATNKVSAKASRNTSSSSSGQCQAYTANETQCQNSVAPGRRSYCNRHGA
jgi:hypothetical protein